MKSTTTLNKKRRTRHRGLHFSHKKVHKIQREEGAPTDAEFATLSRAEAFKVDVVVEKGPLDDNASVIWSGGSGGRSFRYKQMCFHRGDHVIVNRNLKRDDDSDIWIGRIKAIRVHSDGEAWVKLQWYWSGQDLSGYINSFDPSQCAPGERIKSDLVDILNAYTFQDVIHVHQYDESALDPPDIGRREFFERTTYLKYSRRTVQPALGANTCVCKHAYNPYPPELADVSPSPSISAKSGMIMHFCLNSQCRRWYHRSCLAHNFLEPPSYLYRGTRGIRLLSVSPDGFDTLSWTKSGSIINSAPIKRPRGRPRKNTAQSAIPSPHALSLAEAIQTMGISPKVLEHLSEDLVTIAQCPIVRYAGHEEGGWAIGNVKDVVLARRFVHLALRKASPNGENIIMEEHHQVEAITRGELADGLEQSIILLASPNPRYWERRRREYDAAADWFASPPFLCPACQNAL